MEGPSEFLYIEWFKKKLSYLGRTSLDDRWTIAPCGGIDKIPTFLALFAGNKLHIAVLTDFASGQKRKVRDLRENKLLQEGHVLTMEMYAKQEEADIEDVIGRETYFELVNQTYNLESSKRIAVKKSADTPVRVVNEVEGYLAGGKYNHYQPAEYLIQQSTEFTLPGLDGALDRFESIFRDLNTLLT